MCIRDRPEPWIPLPANGSQNHHHIPPAAGERETCTHATASTTGGPHTPRSAGPFPSPKCFLCPLCPITEPAGGPLIVRRWQVECTRRIQVSSGVSESTETARLCLVIALRTAVNHSSHSRGQFGSRSAYRRVSPHNGQQPPWVLSRRRVEWPSGGGFFRRRLAQ